MPGRRLLLLPLQRRLHLLPLQKRLHLLPLLEKLVEDQIGYCFCSRSLFLSLQGKMLLLLLGCLVRLLWCLVRLLWNLLLLWHHWWCKLMWLQAWCSSSVVEGPHPGLVVQVRATGSPDATKDFSTLLGGGPPPSSPHRVGCFACSLGQGFGKYTLGLSL